MHIPGALIRRLRHARRVTVLTGAGTSAESGVPTFREAQTGLWARYRPEDLATPEAFERDPEAVWRWYQWRRRLVREAEPNAGHLALAALQDLVADLSVITQNVDGLHQRAGQRTVIELHGNVSRSICARERTEVVCGDDDSVPRCPACGERVRPDVVWFGEALPEEALCEAMGRSRRCDVFLCVGTSTLVQPAASLPFMALEAGAMVVEINPEETPLSETASLRLPASSATALPALVEALRRG